MLEARASDCAHARLNPSEQLPQEQLGCSSAWSWWDHTLRFPSANVTIETSPLCQYLPSTGDKVATSHDCGHFNPLGLAVEGQPGSQAARRGVGVLPAQPPKPPCSSARRARSPPCWREYLWSLGWMLLPWVLLPLPPCSGHQHRPLSCQNPHLCTMTAISTRSASP